MSAPYKKVILYFFCNIPTLIKIQFDELVTFHSISNLSVLPSKRSKCVFFFRKQAQKIGRIVIRRSCDLNHVQIKEGNRYLRFSRIISFQSYLEPFKSPVMSAFMKFQVPFVSVT